MQGGVPILFLDNLTLWMKSYWGQGILFEAVFFFDFNTIENKEYYETRYALHYV